MVLGMNKDGLKHPITIFNIDVVGEGERHGNALLVQLKAGCLRTRGACSKVGTSVR